MTGRTGVFASLTSMLWASGMALAEPVEVTFAPPEALAEVPLSWEALPIDLPEATEEPAIVSSSEPVTGDWTVRLEPGSWQVNGWNDAQFLTSRVTVGKDGDRFEVAIQEPLPPPPYRCPAGESCSFEDAATGLGFALPGGWASNQPVRAGSDQPVTVVFFEDNKAEGGEAWFLNPTEWNDTFGACREVALGLLCSFSATPASEAAYGIIEPSLKLAEPQTPAMP